MPKRWNKIFLRLDKSYPPEINGQPPPNRTPTTPMDEVEEPFTGDLLYVNTGHDQFGRIDIKQALPFQTNILSLYGELSVTST